MAGVVLSGCSTTREAVLTQSSGEPGWSGERIVLTSADGRSRLVLGNLGATRSAYDFGILLEHWRGEGDPPALNEFDQFADVTVTDDPGTNFVSINLGIARGEDGDSAEIRFFTPGRRAVLAASEIFGAILWLHGDGRGLQLDQSQGSFLELDAETQAPLHRLLPRTRAGRRPFGFDGFDAPNED